MSTTEPTTNRYDAGKPLPAWADVFDNPATAAAFVAVVADVVEQRWEGAVELDWDNGRVVLADGRLVSFANAACELVGSDEPAWRRYLFSMLSSFESFDADALEAELRSWTRIRSRLRVRLFPTGGIDLFADAPDLLGQPIGESLSLIVAADTDAGCVPITADVAEHWDRPSDQAWRTAIKNSRTRSRYEVAAVRTPDTTFMMIEGDLFTTGLARDLSPLLSSLPSPLDSTRPGGFGALVAAPTSRSLLVKPIDDPADVLDDATALVAASLQYQSSAAGAMGANLLWYRGVDDLVPALEFGPGASIKNVAPEPLGTWIGFD